MLRNLVLNGIVVAFFFSFGIANSYEERTVYTQALINVQYDKKNQKKFLASGKYGRESARSASTATGILYHAGKNVDWCKDFGPIHFTKRSPWIALIPRGNCSYEEKIKLAKKYNASAVIVYNNVPVEVPVMKDIVEDMVSVMIANRMGHQLIEIVEKEAPDGAKCEISVGTHYVDRRWKVSRTSVLFVLVSFILLMCISLAWLVFYYVQRFRHLYRNDRKEKQLLSAAKKAISKLRTVSYQSANKDEEDSCAVCLENYKDRETLRVLPCKHEFHKACIDPWLLNHRTCPMCKSNILKSLGVEIPDKLDLSQHDIEGREINATVVAIDNAPRGEAAVPPSSVFIPGATAAWPEACTATRYSSSSSMVSDTDSERSTRALVSAAPRV